MTVLHYLLKCVFLKEVRLHEIALSWMWSAFASKFVFFFNLPSHGDMCETWIFEIMTESSLYSWWRFSCLILNCHGWKTGMQFFKNKKMHELLKILIARLECENQPYTVIKKKIGILLNLNIYSPPPPVKTKIHNFTELKTYKSHSQQSFKWAILQLSPARWRYGRFSLWNCGTEKRSWVSWFQTEFWQLRFRQLSARCVPKKKFLKSCKELTVQWKCEEISFFF